MLVWFWQVSAAGVAAPTDSEVGALQFQASQVISRLEEAVERAAVGGGTTWNNSSGFLSQPKTPEEILALIQVKYIHSNNIYRSTEKHPNDFIRSYQQTSLTIGPFRWCRSLAKYHVALPRLKLSKIKKKYRDVK